LTITVTNPPPGVVLTSPTNGAAYSAPASINLAATVTANGHSITRVQFYDGAALLGESASVPYSLTWSGVGPGSYSFNAVVVYDAGSTAASAPVTASVTGTTGASGLVAAYGFEEGTGAVATDASGSANHGIISAATWTTGGRYGKGLSFGPNALVTIGDSGSLHLASGLTLEAWVYPTALSGWMNLIYKDDGNSGVSYVLQGSSGANPVPSFGLSASPANLRAPSALPLNAWSHVAGTYDGVTMRLYVNGVEVANQAQTGALALATGPLTIGGNAGGENWTGLIDEVRIYSRALSASEILADLNGPVLYRPAPPSGLHVIAGP
jgi:hypothetical protein